MMAALTPTVGARPTAKGLFTKADLVLFRQKAIPAVRVLREGNGRMTAADGPDGNSPPSPFRGACGFLPIP